MHLIVLSFLGSKYKAQIWKCRDFLSENVIFF